MVELTQKPEEINITVSIDDSFSSLVDLDIVLTGYTVTATVEHKDGSENTAFTVVDTDLSAGQVTISLTKTQITAIGLGLHRWYLHYTNGTVSRRAFAGNFHIIQYP